MPALKAVKIAAEALPDRYSVGEKINLFFNVDI